MMSRPNGIDLEPIRTAIEERLLTRRDLLRYSALGLSLAWLPAVPAAGGSSPSGRVVVYSQASESSPIDPHTSVGEVTETVNTVMFDRLINRNLTRPYPGEQAPPIVPVLARSWSVSADATTFTFKLRKGVRFHDGTQFDAAAAKFNIERMGVKSSPNYYDKAGAVTAFLWHHLSGVETPDDETLVLHLSSPFAELPSMMCESTGNPAMISPPQVKKVGNANFGEHPVGTGPYVYVSRQRGVEIVFKANPQPWPGGRTPSGPGITFRPIPDLAARVNALKTGAVDGINFPSADAIQDLQRLGFGLSRGLTPATYYLSMNMREKPFQDVRVRQAVNHAIDREALAKDLWKGVVTPWDQVVAPTSGTAAPGIKGYPYDPARAKALLAQAGYANGFDTVFAANDALFEPTPSAVADQLSKVGIRAKLEFTEWLTYFGAWAGGMKPGIGLNIMSWGMNSPWWLNHVFVNFNTGHIDNEQILKLLAEADREIDETKRLKIYQQVSRLDVEQAYHAPLYTDTLSVMLSAKVRGFVHAKNWWFDLSTVSVS